jgi:hypothetical protein
MQFLNQQSYGEFITQNPQLRKYDESRTALGVNPGKLAMLFDGDTHVASVVFIDHLYADGREIYIPAFDKRLLSSDAFRVRMDTHKIIETEMAKRLGIESLRSGYTDVYPQCPMYWDKSATIVTVRDSESFKPVRDEIQLGFF